MIRVLVVDDSAVTRTYLKFILDADDEIQVVDVATNGEEAIAAVRRRSLDVVIMDINMPQMDGLEATRRIMADHPLPVVIVSATSDVQDVVVAMEALETGAVAVVDKPQGMRTGSARDAVEDLVRTVKSMSEVKVVRRRLMGRPAVGASAMPTRVDAVSKQGEARLIVIGASTGGPIALKQVLSGFDKDLPVPVLIVQHICQGFTEGLVAWLGLHSSLPIRMARNGEQTLPGHGYMAPDDHHMEVDANGFIRLGRGEPEHSLRPAVGPLFRSAARSIGRHAIGVLLTGMGKDGADGLKLMREQGATTIAQDKETSIAHGMPGEAIRIGAAKYILPLEDVAPTLNRLVAVESTP
ncbi:MAG: chemotaxis-specific protein-glutamate methyltransferase CheB [Candidatus Krumholzibacteriia bacterium]